MKIVTPTKQEMQVAMQWAKGAITHHEAARRLKRSKVGAYIILARALKAHLKLWEN